MCTLIMEFVGDKEESEEEQNKRMLEKRWKRKEKRERVEQVEQQRELYEAEQKVNLCLNAVKKVSSNYRNRRLQQLL